MLETEGPTLALSFNANFALTQNQYLLFVWG